MIRFALVSFAVCGGLMASSDFDQVQAERFARMALDCVHREYPNKIAHALNSRITSGPIAWPNHWPRAYGESGGGKALYRLHKTIDGEIEIAISEPILSQRPFGVLRKA